MKFIDYIKSKLLFITLEFIFLILLVILFLAMDTGIEFSLFIGGTFLLLNFIIIIVDFYKKNVYYKELFSTLENLDEKYLITTMMPKATYYEAELFEKVFLSTQHSMNSKIFENEKLKEEYREYVELWVHEIKLPLMAITLLCENSHSSEIKNILVEVEKMDGFIEQALFYNKSNDLNDDFNIRNIILEDLIKDCLKRNSRVLIKNKAKIQMENLKFNVYTDKKWMIFIIGQLLSNSIKYKKSELEIKINAYEKNNCIYLTIEDNGIGVPAEDITKVFKKGYTGKNGRKVSKSTGMGLYLTKKMCKKMNHDIFVQSQTEKKSYTKIILKFSNEKNLYDL